MTAPLYDALTALAGSDPLRLHMPGHKGRLSGAFRDTAVLDFTELVPTGDLSTTSGPIAQAEALYARAVGARDVLFFTCGATQGIFTMLSAAVGMGGTLLLDRGCHKSVYHGMALLDITPRYLLPPLLPDTALPAPVSPELLEDRLRAHPEVRAVLLTSPSYYGVITDLRPLAEICHAHGAYLLVDQAHGAHFPFIGLPSATEEGADLAVASAHKTLPALGSSAVLYVGRQAPWDALALKQMSAVFATTSPSYPILASIDCARAQLMDSDAYRQMVRLTGDLRQRINRETPFHALLETPALRLDPCRLTIDMTLGGLSGREADRLLRRQRIYAELGDERYLVCILTCCDREADLDRLLTALKALPTADPGTPDRPELPPRPIRRQSLRAALFGPRKAMRLRDAAGQISAQILAPYPPGIPVVAPGEEITEKHIAYLQKKSYNIDIAIDVSSKP